MLRRVYVGNLPYSVRDAELKRYFEDAGCAVEEAIVVMEGEGRSKGFGFVSLADDASFAKAKALSGSDMNGRTLRIDEARERTERPRRDGMGAPAHAAAPQAAPKEEVVPMEESSETDEPTATPTMSPAEESDDEEEEDDDSDDDDDESDEEESDEDDK